MDLSHIDKKTANTLLTIQLLIMCVDVMTQCL